MYGFFYSITMLENDFCLRRFPFDKSPKYPYSMSHSFTLGSISPKFHSTYFNTIFIHNSTSKKKHNIIYYIIDRILLYVVHIARAQEGRVAQAYSRLCTFCARCTGECGVASKDILENIF